MSARQLLIALPALLFTCCGVVHAQRTVTTNGGTVNVVPTYTGSSTLGNSSIIIDPNSGNVGVGTTSPQYAVDVTGDLNISGVFRYQGYPLMQAQPAQFNYFMGRSGNLTGSGQYNVGFGDQSLFQNNGTYNTAIGDHALSFNTSGGYNVALGSDAMRNNDSGQSSVAVGVFSQIGNVQGRNNTSVGSSSLQDIESGIGNTAVGNNALMSLTGSSVNGPDNSTNTAVGSDTLTGLVNGGDNVAVGEGAGDDASNGLNQQGSQNIYLGVSTQSLQSGDSNEIVIGAYATGAGSNTVTLGNSGIGKTVLQGNITLAGPGASVTFPDNTVQATAWNGTLKGGDYAESVEVTGETHAYEYGDLIAIDPSQAGAFRRSANAYTKLVAGVYSTKPGLTGRRLPASKPKDDEIPLAMVGIVPVKVTTDNGPIAIGDLLVASGKPGVAMKGTDPARMLGAILGKALSALNEGDGTVEVLLQLQ